MNEIKWESPVPDALWLRNWRLGEWLQAPVSPLFETFLLPILANARQRGGRGHLGCKIPRAWRVLEPPFTVVNGYFYARANPAMITVLRQPPEFIIREIFGGWLPAWNAVGLPTYLARISEYRAIDLHSAQNAELLKALEALAKDVAEVWYALGMASGGLIPLEGFLGGITKKILAEEYHGDKFILLRGFRTKIVEEQESLFALAQVSGSSVKVSSWLEENSLEKLLSTPQEDAELVAFRQQLLDHLEAFGHQTSSLDFTFPTLAEAPNSIGIALRCYWDPDATNPREVEQQTEKERLGATQKILATFPLPKRKIFEKALSRCQDYLLARENIVFHFQKAWPVFRKILLELGNRFSGKHLIEVPDDIFFLTKEELWREGAPSGSDTSLASKVSERQSLWKQRHSFAAPTHIPSFDDQAWQRAMRFPVNIRNLGKRVEQDKHLLVGTAASPGQVRGRARVLGFPSEYNRLEPGDILVTVATTPTWTPLFSKIAAVVTDVGAVSSHSSMVAREYKIPAVVGTQYATQIIKDGDWILVDGSAGKVYLD
jgi:phosphohistidine swiveling domain-containing protein